MQSQQLKHYRHTFESYIQPQICSADAKPYKRRFAKKDYHIGNDNSGEPSFACFFSSMSTLLDTFLSTHSGNIFYAQATHGAAKERKFGPKCGGIRDLGYVSCNGRFLSRPWNSSSLDHPLPFADFEDLSV